MSRLRLTILLGLSLILSGLSLAKDKDHDRDDRRNHLRDRDRDHGCDSRRAQRSDELDDVLHVCFDPCSFLLGKICPVHGYCLVKIGTAGAAPGDPGDPRSQVLLVCYGRGPRRSR